MEIEKYLRMEHRCGYCSSNQTSVSADSDKKGLWIKCHSCGKKYHVIINER